MKNSMRIIIIITLLFLNKTKSIEEKIIPNILKPYEHQIYFTSYNPQKNQTDASPCIGASGKNQCEEVAKGARIIALSQDIVGRSPKKFFTYGDKVWLQDESGDPRCNGEYIVLDTMNKRWKNRGDIFTMDRKNNVSCYSLISKIL